MTTPKLRVLLVDDEKPARTRLGRLLSAFSEIEVIAEAQDGVAALEQIAKHAPDIVFLDIEMPELDGLGVARSLGLDGPQVVFVTAYDEYALKAFETCAVDYLVKPVAESRLQTTIQKILKHRAQKKDSVPLEDVLKKFNVDREGRFAVRAGAKFVICDPKRISAIIARDHYAGIQMDGRELLADDPLDIFEKRLNSDRFVRVHRNAIINLDFLQELEREGDRKYGAILSDAQKNRVQISRERLDAVKAKLGLE